MSRLIYTGNVIERFGKSIPTPFIEKIKIYEDEIEADIAIYLHITDDDSVNESIYDDLSNLNLYAGFGIIYQIPDNLNLGTNFILVNDKIYNDDGKRFAKFVYTRISSNKELQEFPISRAISDSTDTETYYSCFIAISKDEGGANNQNLNFFSEPNEFDKQGIYGVFRNVSSPLVYEKVFTAPIDVSVSNRLATDPFIIYTDLSDIPYKQVPLKSIQRNYHKTTDEFRLLLKTQLASLTSNFENTTDQQVESFRNSISFMAQAKQFDVDFLTELNSVLNTFPSRTSTSEIGLLYNALKNIIFAANDALILEERVNRKIVPNTKLIDLRGYFVAEEQEWSRRNVNTYEPRIDNTGDILYPNVFMERQQLETPKYQILNEGKRTEHQIEFDPGTGLIEPNFDTTSIFGYFFFDYEKALHKKSNISQVFEVQKLLNIWGNNLLDSFFSLKRAEMIKFSRTRLVRKIITPYVDNRPLTNLVLNSASGQEDIVKVVQQNINENEEVIETIDIPYIILRGFDTVEGLSGYRLLAFEFQDYEPANVSLKRGGSYRFNVFLDDDTLDFYDLLIQNYEQTFSELEDYLSKASDFCSFNNVDNRFNDFFVKAISEEYVDQDNYPWMNAPKIFAIHLDLMNDLFSGMNERMSDYASNITSLISPESGNLLSLQNFVNDMEQFYEKYYGAEGEITRLISSRRDPDGNLTPSLKDNTEFIATLGYDDFPDVVDFSVDIEPPPKIRLWNGFEVSLKKNQVKAAVSVIAGTLIMARSKRKSYSEFVEDEGGTVPIQAVDAVFEKGLLRKLLGFGSGAGATTFLAGLAVFQSTSSVGLAMAAISAVTGGLVLGIGALAALIVVMIFNVAKRNRTKEITRFINKFINRIENQATQLTYEGKKSLIERELRYAFGDDKDRPKAYKKLEKKDIRFLEEEKVRIGNIGLYTIACEVKNVYSVSDWFAGKTKNVRN